MTPSINRGKIVLIITAFIALMFGVIYLIDFLSYKNIFFKLSTRTTEITIYQNSQNKKDDPIQVTKLTDSANFRLKPGDYFAISSGETISTDSIPFEITNESTEIVIDPFLSTSYLIEKFSPEIPGINQLIRQEFSNLDRDIYIDDGKFYHYGDWYSTTLSVDESVEREGIDMHAIIMKRVGDSWEIAGYPEILFLYKEHPDIPRDIINSTNLTLNSF